MSEIIEQWIDGAIGETRHALVRQGKPFALVVTRWSDEGRRARWGESYVGRVRAVEKALRGAFVDLGLKDEQGFLPLRDGQAVREGETLRVRVEREGVRGKGPNLFLLERGGEGEKLGRIRRHESDTDRDAAGPASADVREKLDALIDEAMAREVPLSGGGKLIIEPTSALVAIDVDAAGRKGGDPERLALELNIEAAREALRHLRLRNLGG
jgi:Ribonuclease G/E